MNFFYKKNFNEFCQKHDNQRIEIIEYKKVEQELFFYCPACLDENPQLDGIIYRLNDLINQIETNLLIKFHHPLNELDQQDQKIQNLQSKIQMIFGKWKNFIQDVEQGIRSYNFEDEVKKILNNLHADRDGSQEFQSIMQTEYFSNIQKIEQQLEEVKSQLKEFKESQIIQKSINMNEKQQYHTFRGEQGQINFPCAIEIFNNKIMMASCETDVKLWQIIKSDNGNQIQLQEMETLKNHNDRILCSVRSKKTDWFATSGCDGEIYCYKLISNSCVTTKANKHHHNSIYTLILNNKEDQLFSGGYEGKVAVWNVNQKKNSIDFSYELIATQHLVYSLCISPSDTSLISSYYNQQLILWTKNSNTQKYEIKNQKSLNSSAYRSTFIKEDQFVIQYSHIDVTSVFNINNNEIIERIDLELKLGNTEADGDFLFPTIYNSTKQLLIQKYGKYVYVIKQLPNGKLYIISSIQCEDNFNYGSLSDDGNILIIWDNSQKKFKIYSIIEEQKYNSLFQESEYFSIQLSKEL